MLRSLLATVVAYHRDLHGVADDGDDQPERDEQGQEYKTAAQLAAEAAAARAARSGGGGGGADGADGAAAAGAAAAQQKAAQRPQRVPLVERLPRDRALAVRHAKALYRQWEAPVAALANAGRAFEGLEALLGGDGFELDGGIWSRPVRRHEKGAREGSALHIIHHQQQTTPTTNTPSEIAIAATNTRATKRTRPIKNNRAGRSSTRCAASSRT